MKMYQVLFWVIACAVSPIAAAAQDGVATLNLRVIDATTGEPTPARIDVRSDSGEYLVAEDAVLFGGDCDMSDTGAGYTTLESAFAAFADRLDNPYTGSTQFYSDGTSSLAVPPGQVSIRVFKGPEYNVATTDVEVAPGSTTEHDMMLNRWSDMPASGWYSADDHIHIQRPHADLDPLILKMMQAEDIHVANLLQMGKVATFDIAPQYAFGSDSYHQEGRFILATGQETPRTHFLGHTITLGADKPIYDRENYLIYRLVWAQALELGAINGFAHAYSSDGGPLSIYDGLAVVAPHDLLHFMEVLQFNRSGYEPWYDTLKLGYRVTPTAGTDYPCGEQTIVGHERFYTKVDGELTYENWIASVRQGRTFVTTGPMAVFTINGQDIGSEVVVKPGGVVSIAGEVTFDPAREALRFIEVVRDGSVIARFAPVDGANSVRFVFDERIDGSSWFALRGYGSQVHGALGSPIHLASFHATSNVHTAPIYVLTKDGDQIAEIAPSKSVARAWLARLKSLELVLTESNLDELARSLEVPNFDAVPEATLRSNRSALLLEVKQAQSYFMKLSGD